MSFSVSLDLDRRSLAATGNHSIILVPTGTRQNPVVGLRGMPASLRTGLWNTFPAPLDLKQAMHRGASSLCDEFILGLELDERSVQLC